MKKILFLSILFFGFSLANTAWSQEEYGKSIFTSSDGTELPYRHLSPKNMKQGKKYPLVLFLHGAGERGNDNQAQLIHGSEMFLNPSNRDKYPSFVVFPQCPESGFWAYELSDLTEEGFEFLPANTAPTKLTLALKELVDYYLASGNVDPKRVYIMGLSMGGMATFDMVLRYPETFAAAVPICGNVNPARITSKPSTAFRIFHGDADLAVKVQGSRRAYEVLTALGAKVYYTEFPGVGHGSWNPAFSQPDFMEWLFRQHR